MTEDHPEPSITPEQRATAVTVLEGRRLAYDTFMWQAPTLTLIAQAFLLIVLTNDKVGWAVAAVVAIAGVFACLTAMFALWQLRDRERGFADRVDEHTIALGLGSLSRDQPCRTSPREKWWPRLCRWVNSLPRGRSSEGWWRRLRDWGKSGQLEWKAWVMWEVVLGTFIVADTLALIATRI